MRAIRVSATGGPEVLEYVDIPTPEPAAGEALVKIEAIGLNFIDVYHRTGLYKLATPFTPGLEAAGTVEKVGAGVENLRVGDRVAYAMVPGAYADYAVAPAWKLVPIPDGVDTRTAAAAMLQGMTAHYLAVSTYALKEGDSALVHAAAGGAGGLLVQIAKKRGAKVFATVSTEEKAAIARKAGADVVILYTTSDFEAEVLRLTGGKGVNVVYDSVGKTTFDKSLNCVGLRGTLALFGQSSGTVAPVDPSRLAKNGVFLTRPSLAHYSTTRDELLWRAGEVLGWIRSGALKIRIGGEFPLQRAGEAHQLLEARKTTGKVLLIP
ncbi:MAG TPA: quinone oxidoreductase [Thermoanaerobaculia bacterium]|nr:quinone oxidoreductase [Thermoanaerobaculia bacterium]